MKKKILHIAQSNGGVSEYLKMFFKYSNRNDFEISLICSEGYTDEINIFEELIDNVEMINICREISFKKDLLSCYNIYKYAKKNKPDLIYLHSSKAGVLGRIVGAILRIPCIYNPHGWAFNMDTNKRKKRMYILIEKIFSKLTYKIIAISDYEKEIAIKYNVSDENKITVINNGVDIERYYGSKEKYNLKEVKKEIGIPEESFVVGMVARLTVGKGPDTFLSIAKKLLDRYDDVYFVMVGDGEEYSNVIKLIKELNLEDRVRITGWVNDSYKFISIFDIALLTTRWEGFGLALTEYMVSKKPVIASNVGAVPNVIRNNKDGVLVEVDDVNGFYDAIVELRENTETSNYLIDNGYERVINKFDVKILVKQHEELFDKIINEELRV